MTDQVFGTLYADSYDLFYAGKDYERECDLLEAAIQRFGDGTSKSLLDLGCGTGGHALPLHRRGYRVTGVDRSREMLEVARAKAGGTGPELLEGNVQTLDLDRTFDAAVMMFAVLGYQTTNEEVLATLRSVARHLRPGGLFAFDVWYGPGVLREPPGERAKVFRQGAKEVVRVVHGELDVTHHLARVKYELWSVEEGAPIGRTTEAHLMRYFFPQELRLFLSVCDMELVSLSPFGSLEGTPAHSDWNVFVVARRVTTPACSG